jgi:hypothetical protein
VADTTVHLIKGNTRSGKKETSNATRTYAVDIRRSDELGRERAEPIASWQVEQSVFWMLLAPAPTRNDNVNVLEGCHATSSIR